MTTFGDDLYCKTLHYVTLDPPPPGSPETDDLAAVMRRGNSAPTGPGVDLNMNGNKIYQATEVQSTAYIVGSTIKANTTPENKLSLDFPNDKISNCLTVEGPGSGTPPSLNLNPTGTAGLTGVDNVQTKSVQLGDPTEISPNFQSGTIEQRIPVINATATDASGVPLPGGTGTAVGYIVNMGNNTACYATLLQGIVTGGSQVVTVRFETNYDICTKDTGGNPKAVVLKYVPQFTVFVNEQPANVQTAPRNLAFPGIFPTPSNPSGTDLQNARQFTIKLDINDNGNDGTLFYTIFIQLYKLM